MNPRAVKQKVAHGTISGIGRIYNFYFELIPTGWLKVDILEAIMLGAALMFPNNAAD